MIAHPTIADWVRSDELSDAPGPMGPQSGDVYKTAGRWLSKAFHSRIRPKDAYLIIIDNVDTAQAARTLEQVLFPGIHVIITTDPDDDHLYLASRFLLNRLSRYPALAAQDLALQLPEGTGSTVSELGPAAADSLIPEQGGAADPSPADPPNHRGLRQLLHRRVVADPMYMFRTGMFGLAVLLLASAALMVIAPSIGILGICLVFAGWGALVIVDTAVRGRSIQDPRLGTLMLVLGIGSLIVSIVAKLTK